MTENASTYDFKFQRRKDVADFIVALSASVGPTKSVFVGLTNQSMVNMVLIRAKLLKMAEVRKIKL